MNIAIIGPEKARIRSAFMDTTVDQPARYQPTKPDYVADFEGFVSRWRNETAHLSSASDIVTNASFQAIVFMGRKAVPLILHELKKHPDSLIAALPLITGENPVAEDDQGDVDAMLIAWEQWASQTRPCGRI